jgi:hypothetical protein
VSAFGRCGTSVARPHRVGRIIGDGPRRSGGPQ